MDTLDTLISCENLSFAYGGEEGRPLVPVLHGVDLSIRAGELVAVLGHNGSGKSTLAKHFNAILLPQGGSCAVAGIDTRDEDRLLDIRRNVGMVFQNPDNQIVATIVEEDVAFGLENLGVPTAEIRARVDEALHSVGMYEYRLHAPHQLSGGQKQRVAIAGVIAMRPNCLVLDEPTAMLDPRGRREVMETITSLRDKYGIAVVLITHFMDEAARCERVVVMNDGEILYDATASEVFSHVAELKAVGLDVPQATELMFMLKNEGYDLADGIITDAQCVAALDKLLRSGGVKTGANHQN